ncbi:hypothetical protein [Oscillatoria salina]|uniref:hypothetical protein n=1 Tax=Oscillatoria salina TaxID=331517 RepID=UPI001CCDB059|nr:hypothetical protein [Oscillatoria salina]MBZ8182842.1 hypothetical protein [Oscillatoria salina IIICB1]
MNLNVELITGDVNKVDGIDFLLIGHKNPLREQICRETGSLFKAVDSETWMFPHKYELLEVSSYKWKQVAAIKFRANGKIGETQFVRISSPIATALKKPQIESIGILPPTWRNPEYCALGVIYSLWIIGYAAASGARSSYPDLMNELFPNPANVKFQIISQTGTEYFEEILKNDCDLMWKFVRRLCKQRKDNLYAIPKSTEKKIPVIFNISKSLI